jgi:acyl-CoA thioester hydrolase
MPADPWPSALSGRFDGTTHVFPLRVYYEDTDAGGVVYHAGYLRFVERARTEMMRLLGTEHGALLERAGVLWTVRGLTADFRRPARLDDRLEVATAVRALRRASLDLVQTVRLAAPDAAGAAAKPPELATIEVRLACIDRSGRPARLPPVVRAALLALAGADAADDGIRTPT